MMNWVRWNALLWVLSWLSLPAGWVHAGKTIYVGDKSPRQLVSMADIKHDVWDGLLKKYVDPDGLVNYRAWKASTADVRELDGYLDRLSTADPRQSVSKQAKLAFWINAYNAVTIRGMLREYPTDSIRNHTARIFGYNIWNDLLLYVGGSTYSLDQMEHAVLRKLGDPRIHFAVVCASKSCPRLLNAAYTVAEVDAQLAANARDFFSRPTNFRYPADANRMYLSSILQWYGEDFGEDRRQQLRTLAPWLPTAESREAARAASVQISYLRYDWSINEQPAKRAESATAR